jgi:two-component system sensor histidine kinase YesM
LQSGNFHIKLPPSSTSEIDFINSNFNYTVESLQRQINENYANKLLNKEIELRNLQNQINEHFLYNTLDSIRWLARKEEALQTSDMVLALANFYRLSLSSGKEVIPISDIITMLNNYLSIQKYRLGDSLNYSINCESILLNQRILKNLLQPIVENAIVHGILGLENGIIDINVTNINEEMRIMVTDNGKGFSDERLKQVREQLDLESPFCENSFALKSIQSQMQIFYGYRIPLHIDSTYNQGTRIWFDLPISSEGESQDDSTIKDDYCR